MLQFAVEAEQLPTARQKHAITALRGTRPITSIHRLWCSCKSRNVPLGALRSHSTECQRSSTLKTELTSTLISAVAFSLLYIGRDSHKPPRFPSLAGASSRGVSTVVWPQMKWKVVYGRCKWVSEWESLGNFLGVPSPWLLPLPYSHRVF